MTQQVLILGGGGRIGSSVADDLIQHTSAEMTVTCRTTSPLNSNRSRSDARVRVLALDLEDRAAVAQAIAAADLVIHCAGPFSYRDDHVLQSCIEQGVNYLDVADNPTYVKRALAKRQEAKAAGVTAIVSSGVFPGISNSMVRQGVEQLDQPEHIHLSYVVAGSGGAGITVMRTTFLELQHPFKAWIDGQWQQVTPYSQRERVEFPAPYNRCGVYWFSTIEAMTLPESFPVQTVTTKFGSVPDFYNHLTWMTAHWLPKPWLRNPAVIEFFAKASYGMTEVSDRFTGVSIAMRAEVSGQKQGKPAQVCSTVVHDNTAVAAGCGTGSIAQLMLSGQLSQPGIWPVEQALSTPLFEQTMASRGIQIHPSQHHSQHHSQTQTENT